MHSGAAREGSALLQGLLICGDCGRRMTVRYTGNGGLYPSYECNWRKREGLTGSSCLTFRCDTVEPVVVRRVFEILKPRQIEIAVKALEELERGAGRSGKRQEPPSAVPSRAASRDHHRATHETPRVGAGFAVSVEQSRYSREGQTTDAQASY